MSRSFKLCEMGHRLGAAAEELVDEQARTSAVSYGIHWLRGPGAPRAVQCFVVAFIFHMLIEIRSPRTRNKRRL